MEMPQPEDSSVDIEVLDGQTSVEELLADLGFEWRYGTPAPELATTDSAGSAFGQPALS